MKIIFFILLIVSTVAMADSSDHSWVRVFADGTHNWKSSQFQTFPARLFARFNWEKYTKHTCEDNSSPGDPECPIIETSPRSQKAISIFNTLASYELRGIPTIKSEPFPGGIYLKKVFSKNAISCLPLGTQVDIGTDKNLCCSGWINPATSRCQLRDYVDVSVYTNINVSSEAKKLNHTLFDKNGYFKDPAHAVMLACLKQMCASNTVAYGALVSRLPIPGQENYSDKLYRFIEGNKKADNENGLLDVFNRGLKLNNHAYCVPESLFASVPDLLTIIRCDENFK